MDRRRSDPPALRILVCIKDVPETDAPVILDEPAGWIKHGDAHNYRMNRYDEYAVEEAALIKEEFPDTILDALTVGPARSDKILRRAIGMGMDNATHIFSEHTGYLSPFVTASWIADYARGEGYDLIFTGVISEDNMQGQTGPLIGELLSIPCATSIIHQRILPGEKLVYVEREIEGGTRDCLQIKLPAVLTIQSGINRPRYPSLSKALRAKKFLIPSIHANSYSHIDAREELIAIQSPHKTRKGTILEGSASEKAAKLAQILDSKALLG